MHAKKHHVAKPKLSRSAIGVVVFNGNGRTGAASAAAARLSGLGYRIRGKGNAARQDYATTVVMYKRGYEAEGVRLAHDLHVHVVGPLDGLKPSALHGGKLAVVLGARLGPPSRSACRCSRARARGDTAIGPFSGRSFGSSSVNGSR